MRTLLFLFALAFGEDSSEPQPYEDQPGCWFGVHTLPLVDTNDDSTPDRRRLVGVQAVPVVSVVGNRSVTIERGEPVTLMLRVTSARQCGAIDVTAMTFTLERAPRHFILGLTVNGKPVTTLPVLAVLERNETFVTVTVDTHLLGEGLHRLTLSSMNWTDLATDTMVIDDHNARDDAFIDIIVKGAGS